MDNKTTTPYIKITEEDIIEDVYEPSKDEILLDNFEDMEYTTPYTDNDDFTDLYGTGEQFEVGGMFDDR
jgi:hypothetical protein